MRVAARLRQRQSERRGDAYCAPVDDLVGVLGPLVIGEGGSTLGSAKERAVVELLAVRAPLPVPDDELVDALWGENPPATAIKTLQSLVSRLRRSVPEVAVQRAGAGIPVAGRP